MVHSNTTERAYEKALKGVMDVLEKSMLQEQKDVYLKTFEAGNDPLEGRLLDRGKFDRVQGLINGRYIPDISRAMNNAARDGSGVRAEPFDRITTEVLERVEQRLQQSIHHQQDIAETA